jgi:quercetin dioxygenase-like cupin family protein
MSNEKFLVCGGAICDEEIRFSDLLEINGKLNIDVASAPLYLHEATGSSIRKSVIGPNGYLAPHASSNTVCIQVMEGSGTIGNVDEQGNILSELSVSKNDFIIFEAPMPRHYYKAGDEGLSYIAITLKAN